MTKDFFFYTDQMAVGYGKSPLIENIGIRLKRGEILTLIGPNGAGKSTILKSIAGQLKLLGGNVWLEGEEIRKLDGQRRARQMAVVLTERVRTELMTCEDVVAAGRYPYTGRLGILKAEDKEKVMASMELVHVLELKDRDFAAVSDGQRQRVLLARAICQEPELILLDEPTSFLDVKHKLEFVTILRRLAKEKRMAVILSLHELDLAQKVSDWVACVKGDRLDRMGRPEEIFTGGYMNQLYDVTEGAYHEAFGCAELLACKGKPRVFVIGGGGRAAFIYRRLQREGIPFATGVLHKNDMDYETALYLASEIIAEEAFEPIRQETLEQAVSSMRQCEQVICCLESFGTMNRKNEELVKEAKRIGILIGQSEL